MDKSRNVLCIETKEVVKEEVKDNLKQLKDYLRESVCRVEDMMVKQSKRVALISEPFPYHSYLKHKKQLPILDPYIVSAETKIYNNKQKANNTLTLRDTTKIEKKYKEEKTSSFYGEGYKNTTARVLRDKYKSLYDKLERRTTPIKDIKVNSPFRSYITEQRKRKMQMLKLTKNQIEKVRVEKINSPEVVKEVYKDQSKLYIGPENFPLSIYERSNI